jgi:hypothetical protein
VGTNSADLVVGQSVNGRHDCRLSVGSYVSGVWRGTAGSGEADTSGQGELLEGCEIQVNARLARALAVIQRLKMIPRGRPPTIIPRRSILPTLSGPLERHHE